MDTIQRTPKNKKQAAHVLADDEVIAAVVNIVVVGHKFGDGDLPLGSEAVARRFRGGLPEVARRSKHWKEKFVQS